MQTAQSGRRRRGLGGIAWACVVAAALSVLSSCSAPGTASISVAPNGAATLASGGASSVYLIQAPGTLLQFAAGSNGTSVPASTFAAPMTVTAVATDSLGELYLGGYTATNQAEILVYAASSTGALTVPPVRTILTNGVVGNPNTLQIPSAMVVGANGLLYVLSTANGFETLQVFSATANGFAIASSFLQGGALYTPLDVAVDAAGNVYVANVTSANTGTILVYAVGALNGFSPARMITSPQIFWGVAVDANQNIFAVEDSPTTTSAGSIVEFAAGASGAAVPKKVIAGSATGLYVGGSLRMDGVGNLYVNNETSSATYTVEEFGPDAEGNVAPAASFSSASWTSGNANLAVK